MAKHLDLAGQRYGSVVMLEYVGNNNNRQAMWKARCDCGVEKIVLANKFRVGGHTSCGCKATNIPKDMTGLKFGFLTVIERAETTSKSRAHFWRAICKCGNTTVVAGAKLRNGHTTSCGCYAVISATCANLKHGMSDTPEYDVWSNMWQRCTNPKHIGWGYYGARGIAVCERWKKFENFIADMGRRPHYSLTIERVDNDAGYSPENCVWATRAQQNANKRPRKDSLNKRIKP